MLGFLRNLCFNRRVPRALSRVPVMFYTAATPGPDSETTDPQQERLNNYMKGDLADPVGMLRPSDASKSFVRDSQRDEKVREATHNAIRRHLQTRMSSGPYHDPQDPYSVPLLEKDPSFLNEYAKLSMYERMGVDWFDPSDSGFVGKVCAAMDDLYGGSLENRENKTAVEFIESKYKGVVERQQEAVDMATKMRREMQNKSYDFRPPDLFGMHPIALGRLLGKDYIDSDIYHPSTYEEDAPDAALDLKMTMVMDPVNAVPVMVPPFVKSDIFVAFTQYGVDVETMARYYHIKPNRIRAILRLLFMKLNMADPVRAVTRIQDLVRRNMGLGVTENSMFVEEMFSFQEYFPSLPHMTRLNFSTLDDDADESVLWDIIRKSRENYNKKNHIKAFRPPNFKADIPVPSSKIRPSLLNKKIRSKKERHNYAFYDLSENIDPRYRSVFVPAIYGSDIRRLTELEQFERTWNGSKKSSIRGDPISVLNFKSYLDSRISSQYLGRKPLDAIMDIAFGIEQDTRWHNLPAKTREKLKKAMYKRSLERYRTEVTEYNYRFRKNPAGDDAVVPSMSLRPLRSDPFEAGDDSADSDPKGAYDLDEDMKATERQILGAPLSSSSYSTSRTSRSSSPSASVPTAGAPRSRPPGAPRFVQHDRSSTNFKSLNPHSIRSSSPNDKRQFHTSAVALKARDPLSSSSSSPVLEAYLRGQRSSAPVPRPSSSQPSPSDASSPFLPEATLQDYPDALFPDELLRDLDAMSTPPPVPKGADAPLRLPGDAEPMHPLENHMKDTLLDRNQLFTCEALMGHSLNDLPLPERWKNRPLVIDYWNYVRFQRQSLHSQFHREKDLYKRHKDEGAFGLYYMMDDEEVPRHQTEVLGASAPQEESDRDKERKIHHVTQSIYDDELLEPPEPPGTKPEFSD